MILSQRRERGRRLIRRGMRTKQKEDKGKEGKRGGVGEKRR